MKNNRFVACILVPALLFLGVFSIAPLFYGLGVSLFNYNPLNQVNPFVGLENYRYMFRDPLFWGPQKHTVFFVALATVLNITITLFLAQVISTLPSNKLRSAFRTILFLPCIARWWARPWCAHRHPEHPGWYSQFSAGLVRRPCGELAGQRGHGMAGHYYLYAVVRHRL